VSGAPDFQSLFEAAPANYLVLDPQLVIVAISDGYLAATGSSRDDVVDRHVFEAFPANPDDPGAEGVRNLSASLQRVLRDRVSDAMSLQRYDIPRPASEGGGFEQRFWSPHNSPVLAPDGSVAYVIHEVQDVTDFVAVRRATSRESEGLRDPRLDEMEADVVQRARQVAEAGRALKEANEELTTLYERSQELDRIKTQFFSNVSHELRTPLALILAPVERILSDLPVVDPNRADLDMVLRNARLLLGHVNDLLDASKIEAARLDLEYTEIDLGHLVRLVANSFETLAADRSVHFVVRAPRVDLPAQLDSLRVQQVLLNLLSNAFKFTPANGTVRVELLGVTAGGTARVEVADSGPGIGLDMRDVVFERFEQIDDSATRRVGGTGLGLHIARELVSLHGGTIGVDDAPEGGAMFVVELPVLAPPGTAVREPAATGIVGRPGDTLEGGQSVPALDAVPEAWPVAPKSLVDAAAEPGEEAGLVLVVEDNVDMNRFVCDALGSSFRVEAAFDGRTGFDMARALRPDLIVCDFMMPEMSGDDLVRAVRSEPRLETTPILILTARNDASARIDVLREGANDYLLKPFFQPELRARVENLVKVRQSDAQARALEMANERTRIARDLHDLVIQRVFGAGMRLSAMLPTVGTDAGAGLRAVVAELDSVISDIRTTIFDLQPDTAPSDGMRASVLKLVADAGDRLGFQPRVQFDGPIDTVVDGVAGEQLLAVLRESLSNVIRHAQATSVAVEVAAYADLVLVVADDGVGPEPGLASRPHHHADHAEGFGLRNMASRAAALGGSFDVRSLEPRGTRVEWRVPLGTPSGAGA
jgi:signal transduction histidine kinase